ncbi:hypothetical protein conserved [Leishmania donovani]|uniref:Uncharacterized protein n=3 Tax=Leishmania donovani species complex TaxID=38574 RepID=A4I1P1_LEIIN|nr:conserved hypothetical protein [Leishmania infantum JPCM5]XP_003861531.1 hypothetical protein, conserved [Leishmania donovani]CAC9494915.1 hypothetical_protein_-_conserved [Leishmania infantum]AYU79538.1 hypothetical protein LdCL_250025900 [Leishmania donovani]TPP48843.1 hypothetical protein CGC20_26310 [Leishmania donovani]CAJ1989528.1 hypothetical protein conserved [Leishmania donovani]CAM68671.1 conserved hypothetical protein [Leishmania infantum JPCM5]|eukprot:XP_001466232.1 conserved hypothetical protein [Leishmania infantum JPCM5]
MAARLLEPTHSSAASLMPTVLIISGFPWYTSELAVHRYLTDVYPAAEPVTTRLYTNPTNGASRGHCFVEYNLPPSSAAPCTSAVAAATANSLNGTDVRAIAGGFTAQGNSSGGNGAVDALLPPVLREVKRRVEEHPYECVYLKVHAYVLTSQRWSRAGRLPELPTDPPAALWRGRAGVLVGYGDEGFSVRAGRELGLPNTVTADGKLQLERLRKRLRTTSARRASGHLSAE